MVAAASAPVAVGVAVNRILDLCRAQPNGLQESVLDENVKDLNMDVVSQALNALLTKGHIQIFKQGAALIYKEANKDDIRKFKNLSSEDMLVYQAIQQSTNTGIWTMDLKRKTNLQQPQVTKAIKNLETRNLIKAVKSVEHKSRKVYMLFELEPSRDVTGGAFYTEQEFDVEFISVLKHQCLNFILKQDRRNWCRGWQLWRMWQILFVGLESPKRNYACKTSSRFWTCWYLMERLRKKLVVV